MQRRENASGESDEASDQLGRRAPARSRWAHAPSAARRSWSTRSPIAVAAGSAGASLWSGRPSPANESRRYCPDSPEQGSSPVLKGFVSKSGKPFEARLRLDGGEVRFEFGS